jgi:hypothetical protein
MIVGREVAPDFLSVDANTSYSTGAQSLSVELNAGHYFLVIQRQQGMGFAPANFKVSWDSSVSTLYTPEQYHSMSLAGGFNPLAGLPPPEGVKLHCLEETDSPFDLGSDDIAVELFADGVNVASISNGAFGGGFDTGDHRYLDPWISRPVVYSESLELKIVEEDTVVDDLGGIWVHSAAAYRSGSLPVARMLSSSVMVATEKTDFDGGTYSLTLTLG